MKLIENETKFTHKSMPSWGVGIFRESDGTYITVDFENVGIKKFGMKSIGTTLIVMEEKVEKIMAESEPISQTIYVPVNAQNGALIQYDGESESIAGKNIIESLKGMTLLSSTSHMSSLVNTQKPSKSTQCMI